MRVLLTGGTGLVGAQVLKTLVAHDHDVTALVRSESSAATVRAAGAMALHGDLMDVAWLTAQLRTVDGAIHTASPGDHTSADVDRGVVTAVAAAFAGTGKPYVHTGGIWAWGSGEDLTEDQPFNPPALTSWRAEIERLAFEVEGARVAVVAPAVVYGHGKGMPNLLSAAPRTETGALLLLGDGGQHWATVYADDLADLYLRVLREGRHGRYYFGASGQSPTVRELGEAASRAAGANGAVQAESAEALGARFGAAFAEALLLDQQASGARGRTELGWLPVGPSLVQELETGSYAPART